MYILSLGCIFVGFGVVSFIVRLMAAIDGLCTHFKEVNNLEDQSIFPSWRDLLFVAINRLYLSIISK